MHQWELKYGLRPDLVVYTNRQELITDSLNRWNITFCWPMDSIIDICFPPKALEKYISRVHDRKFDSNFSHCLYVATPTPIDLSSLYTCMDLDHTMYYDHQERYAIYRRDITHRVKQINIDSTPPTGVIFIDCWESNICLEWIYNNGRIPVENFYQRMITKLWEFNLHSFVFLDSDFEAQALANDLKGWEQQPWSTHLDSLIGFEKHLERTGIKHWIVVGGHWKFCTHDKPLGFLNLLKLKQQDPSLHFYSLPDSTAKFIKNDNECSILSTCTQQDYLDDSLNWDYTNNIVELKI